MEWFWILLIIILIACFIFFIVLLYFCYLQKLKLLQDERERNLSRDQTMVSCINVETDRVNVETPWCLDDVASGHNVANQLSPNQKVNKENLWRTQHQHQHGLEQVSPKSDRTNQIRTQSLDVNKRHLAKTTFVLDRSTAQGMSLHDKEELFPRETNQTTKQISTVDQGNFLQQFFSTEINEINETEECLGINEGNHECLHQQDSILFHPPTSETYLETETKPTKMVRQSLVNKKNFIPQQDVDKDDIIPSMTFTRTPKRLEHGLMGKIDLHGHRARELPATLDRFLIKFSKKLRNSIRSTYKLGIITGRGLHSGSKGPVLRPIAEQRLAQLGIR